MIADVYYDLIVKQLEKRAFISANMLSQAASQAQGGPPQGMPPQGGPPQGMPPQGGPPQGMPPQEAPVPAPDPAAQAPQPPAEPSAPAESTDKSPSQSSVIQAAVREAMEDVNSNDKKVSLADRVVNLERITLALIDHLKLRPSAQQEPLGSPDPAPSDQGNQEKAPAPQPGYSGSVGQVSSFDASQPKQQAQEKKSSVDVDTLKNMIKLLREKK